MSTMKKFIWIRELNSNLSDDLVFCQSGLSGFPVEKGAMDWKMILEGILTEMGRCPLGSLSLS